MTAKDNTIRTAIHRARGIPYEAVTDEMVAEYLAPRVIEPAAPFVAIEEENPEGTP